MSNQPLTKREIIFCQSYLANDFNGLKALKIAGYSETSPETAIRKILARPRIKVYLEELQATAAAAATLSKAWVIGEAMNLYKEAMAAKAFAPAAKVLGMLGSEVGALQENKQINQTVTVEHLLGSIPKGLEQPAKQIN